MWDNDRKAWTVLSEAEAAAKAALACGCPAVSVVPVDADGVDADWSGEPATAWSVADESFELALCPLRTCATLDAGCAPPAPAGYGWLAV